MIARIVVPQLFENMEEATIGAWHKSQGDTVAIGELLCDLITEKTTFELPAEAGGILRRIVAAEKSIVPVGTVIALVGAPADALPEVDAENAALRARKAETLDTPLTASSESPRAPIAPGAAAASGGSRVRATPAARRAARDRGVAIEAVAAALPGKVLSEEDVVAFAGRGS